jgi:hypothetical protein
MPIFDVAATLCEGSVRYMSSLLIRVLVLASLLNGVSCASRQKNTSRIYAGDAPSIKYLETRETAGGPVGGR